LVDNPCRSARKRNPPATRRRALELLAPSRDGCTEAIMLAQGFTMEMLVDLVRAGLAMATAPVFPILIFCGPRPTLAATVRPPPLSAALMMPIAQV
jgi:hypothetical protein